MLNERKMSMSSKSQSGICYTQDVNYKELIYAEQLTST